MPAPPPLTDGSIPRAIARLALPIVASNLLQIMYQLTDLFWVGRLDAAAVASVSLVFPINFLMIALGGGLPIAGSVLIAQARGRGDLRSMRHIAGQTCLLTLIVAATLASVGFRFSESLMRFMGASPEVLPGATRFLEMTFLAFVFVFAFFAFQTLMRGLGVVVAPMLIVLATVLLNFVLDPLLIFGGGPIPAMGVAGAALATLCTQALAAAVGIGLLASGRFGVRVRWRNLRPDPALMRTMLRVGLPASLEQSTRAIGMGVMTLLVSGFGTVAIAAYGLGMRVLAVVIVPALGISLATSTLVAQNIGAGRVDRAAATSRAAGAIAFASLSAAGAVLFLFAATVAAFVLPRGGEAIPQSATMIRILSLSFGFIGIQQVAAGTLRGAGDTFAAMLLAMIALWGLQFPLAYALSRHSPLGATGIWWALASANVVSAVIAMGWLRRGTWKSRRLLTDVDRGAVVRDELAAEEGAGTIA
ncbi:MAG: MATE family efflux transporter [Planctomyces sp.]|nr:MATE family efflux transporter [Planctomyces sp.]